ncbi:MAG TPA: hypothetical protein VEH27_18085 [Methylomirabilota bacterium]|nr:hypothetical protein [Methylomirabilota bacterium]
MSKQPKTAPRPTQNTPSEVVSDLLSAIRNQFYADAEPKKWAQDAAFIRKNVVLWPAAWLNKRGVTLPPERYKQLLLDVFNEIKVHGKTGVVKYWPGYLMKCVQERFKHQEDAIYDEAKALRASIETALQMAGSAAAKVDPITVMAEARRDLLKQPRRSPTKPKKQTSQPDLFQL